MTLDTLPIGKRASIRTVGGEDALRLRLLDMGLIPRTAVAVRKTAPLGDPLELELRGYTLTLRLDDAKRIELDESTVADANDEGRADSVPTGGKRVHTEKISRAARKERSK